MRADFFREQRDQAKMEADLTVTFLKVAESLDERSSGNICILTDHGAQSQNADLVTMAFAMKFGLDDILGWRNLGEGFYRWYVAIDGEKHWQHLSERDRNLLFLAQATFADEEFPSNG